MARVTCPPSRCGSAKVQHPETDEDAALGVASCPKPGGSAAEPCAETGADHRVHAVRAEAEEDVDRPQHERLRPDRSVTTLDELRQEGQEEQGDLWVEQADEEGLGEQPLHGPHGWHRDVRWIGVPNGAT